MAENEQKIVEQIFIDLLILKGYIVLKSNLHYLCRTSEANKPVHYPTKSNKSKDEETIIRPLVPDNFVHWWVDWPVYKPIEYTSKRLLSNPSWADPQDVKGIKFNEIDGQINRKSYVKLFYKIDDETGRPLNPIGRTGIKGRGRLGKWGPNHAGDAIVSRWKRDESGSICRHQRSNKNILEFVAILRSNSQQWAIPGGMCDNGEDIKDTVKREFFEEATDSHQQTDQVNESNKKLLNEFFNKGKIVYQGYCDDPRNTDNAWMETTVYNFHDDEDKILKQLKLHAGDDAGSVKWVEIDANLQLYASHKVFIAKVAEMHNAHFY